MQNIPSITLSDSQLLYHKMYYILHHESNNNTFKPLNLLYIHVRNTYKHKKHINFIYKICLKHSISLEQNSIKKKFGSLEF